MAGLLVNLVNSLVSGATSVLNTDVAKGLAGGLSKKYLGTEITFGNTQGKTETPPPKPDEKDIKMPWWGWGLIGVAGISFLVWIFKPKKKGGK